MARHLIMFAEPTTVRLVNDIRKNTPGISNLTIPGICEFRFSTDDRTMRLDPNLVDIIMSIAQRHHANVTDFFTLDTNNHGQ